MKRAKEAAQAQVSAQRAGDPPNPPPPNSPGIKVSEHKRPCESKSERSKPRKREKGREEKRRRSR